MEQPAQEENKANELAQLQEQALDELDRRLEKAFGEFLVESERIQSEYDRELSCMGDSQLNGEVGASDAMVVDYK